MDSPRSRMRPTLAVLGLGLLLAACQPGPASRPQAVTAGPVDPSRSQAQAIYLRMIIDMQRQGAWQASLAHLAAYRQQYGASTDITLLQAEALRNSGQTESALASYRSLLDSPQAAAAWHGIGLIEAGRRPAAALAALARASALQPDNASYLADLGEAQLRRGAMEQAGPLLARAVTLAPQDPHVVSCAASWQWLSGHPEQAERLIQHAGLSASARHAITQQARQLRDQLGPLMAARQPPLATSPAAPGKAAHGVIPARLLDRWMAPAVSASTAR